MTPVQQSMLPDLYRQIFPEITDRDGLFGQKALWYGLSISDQLVAFYTIGQVDDTRLFVYNIGVNPDQRQKGYGRQLMEDLIQRYGDKDVFLFVHQQNKIAIHLYKSFSFEKVEREYLPPPDQICMKREKRIRFH